MTTFSATPSDMPFETAKIAGVPLAAVSLAGLGELMVADCRQARRGGPWTARTVFDLNAHALSLRTTDADYRAALDQADIIHADGGFLIPVSRLRSRTPVPERSATTDFIWEAARRAEAEGLSFFLLGGEPGLAERAAARLVAQHPGLKIAGLRDGFFDAGDENQVIDAINASGADILWVGMGKPNEQIFSIRNRERLNVGWIVTCGGCFNFVTGDYRRAPDWMQRLHLEWLHRLACRPRSMFMRNLITNPHALYLALTR